MERYQTILLIAGLGFWGLAWVIMGAWPMTLLSDLPVQSYEELAAVVQPSFFDLEKRYPESFAVAFGEASPASYAKALEQGKDVYVAEGCWHCHSQQIRPVSNESLRWGPVSMPGEYQNVTHLPQLLGTRRVGPDLSREANRRSNDWHVAHFYEPTWVVPTSVMPSYKWLFDDTTDAEGNTVSTPNGDGLALIAYIQWLGSWIENASPNFYNVENYLENEGTGR